MSVKMECDNCHSQVSNEGLANHGWIMISQQMVVIAHGDVPIQGTFCTVSCSIEWLASKQKVPAMDQETFEKSKEAAKEVYGTVNPSEEAWGHEKAQEEYATGYATAAITGMVTLSAFTGKAGEILRKVVGTDEPIAIFRARDLLSIFALQAYAEALEKYGAHYDQQESWSVVRDDFRLWQNAHTSRVRLPD